MLQKRITEQLNQWASQGMADAFSFHKASERRGTVPNMVKREESGMVKEGHKSQQLSLFY